MQSKITIFPARNVITMNPSCPVAPAVAVGGNRILAVGTVDELRGWGTCDVNTTFADRVLIPGLIEAHSHIGEGTHWRYPYVGYFERYGPDGKLWKGCQSFDELLDVLKRLDSELADPDEPLIVWGLDPIYFERERLNASHLDLISETRPIFVFHVSDHLATVNSALMRKMGITRNTETEGVDKDVNDEPTGELQEPFALRL
ncbi:MAG: amidohydrolase family protein, partial [Proteobacteria bacterium]|nr:amidohydrolase family protein [Pseudomonadota bacterium]